MKVKKPSFENRIGSTDSTELIKNWLSVWFDWYEELSAKIDSKIERING